MAHTHRQVTHYIAKEMQLVCLKKSSIKKKNTLQTFNKQSCLWLSAWLLKEPVKAPDSTFDLNMLFCSYTFWLHLLFICFICFFHVPVSNV